MSLRVSALSASRLDFSIRKTYFKMRYKIMEKKAVDIPI